MLSRLYDLDTPIDTTSGRRTFAALADSLIDRQRPGLYNQAIMDFGALCCLPAQPRCTECPLRDRCLAFAARTVDVRPVKQGRTAVEPRYFNYLHVECGDELVLRRRGAGDIWQGLYEFPLIETPEPVEYTVLAAMPEFCALFKDAGAVCLAGTVTMPVHQLSHRAIHAVFYRIVVERWTPSLREMLVIPREILGDYAVSRLTERYLSR
mgnify:FL=1